jgi:hypothetical protein
MKASAWIVANGGQWPTGETTKQEPKRKATHHAAPALPPECAACPAYIPDAAKCREVKKVNNCGCVLTWKAGGHNCPLGKW